MRIANHGRAVPVFLLTALTMSAGCGPKATPVETPSGGVGETSDEAWAASTEAYRPPSTLSALATAEKAPADPTVYAGLADAFAGSEVAGMSFLYALYYRAMGTDCASDGQAALAIARILAQRVAANEVEGGRFEYEVRLAPEPAPARIVAGGRTRVPLANRVATSVAAALPGYQGHASIADYHGVLARWVDGAADFGSANELHAWLAATKKAGHLEAFSHLVFGLAFPDEFKKYEASHEKELRAALAYFDGHLLVPRQLPRPDATD